MHSLQIGIEIILMFFVLVTLHEWGHYYFAKKAGILVREFAIGFGPKLFSYKKDETRFTLRLLPIGGFCRMAGEDPEIVQITSGQMVGIQLRKNEITHIHTDQYERLPNIVQGEVQEIDLEKDLFVQLNVDGESLRFPVHPKALTITKGKETQIAPLDRQFASKSVGKRALAIFAGPVMNVLLAFALFLIYSYMSGVPTAVKIGAITSGSPAETVGLKAGDVIREANGQTIGKDSEKLVTIIRGSAVNQPVTLIIERNQEQLQKQVVPSVIEGEKRIGTTLDYVTRSVSITEGVKLAWDEMVFMTKQILIGFKQLIFGQFKLDDLGGPVRTVEFTAQVAEAGIQPMIRWSALLSLYLAIFNLLPIPALDGSRLVFLGIEAFRKKPIDPNQEGLVHFIGFALLMLLMVAVTYNDILRLIKG